jgi:hypothetical protein
MAINSVISFKISKMKIMNYSMSTILLILFLTNFKIDGDATCINKEILTECKDKYCDVKILETTSQPNHLKNEVMFDMSNHQSRKVKNVKPGII